MPPKDERPAKLTKEQKLIREEVGVLIFLMEWYIPVVRVVHALTTVGACPPVAACRVVLDGVWAYMYYNRVLQPQAQQHLRGEAGQPERGHGARQSV